MPDGDYIKELHVYMATKCYVIHQSLDLLKYWFLYVTLVSQMLDIH